MTHLLGVFRGQARAGVNRTVAGRLSLSARRVSRIYSALSGSHALPHLQLSSAIHFDSRQAGRHARLTEFHACDDEWREPCLSAADFNGQRIPIK
jgi:hypothetical protein